MKMSPEHVEEIRLAIEDFLAAMASKGHTEEAIRQRYRDREIPRGDAVQDIDKRFRWDLYYAAARYNDKGLPDSTNGYNDAHVYTALKSLVPSLTKEN